MKFTKVQGLTFAVAIVFTITAGINLFAQEKKINKKSVPAKVMVAFQKAYPKAVVKGTSIETEHGNKFYEIESMEGTKHIDLLITSAGKITEIEETILSSELPKGALESINKKIPGGKIERSEKVTSGSKITYELSVVGKTGKFSMVLNKLGKIIKVANENSKTGDED